MELARENCYHIRGQQKVRGVPRTAGVARSLPLPIRGGFVGEHLIYARVEDDHHGVNQCLVPAKPTKRLSNAIFYISVPSLDFGRRDVPEGMNLWPGPEMGNKKPLWWACKDPGLQYGSARKIVERAEVWELDPEGPPLVMLDQYGGLRQLLFNCGDWSLLPVLPQQLASYICTRGLRMSSYQGAEWALRNLEVLKRAHPADQLIAFATNQVREHLQSLA